MEPQQAAVAITRGTWEHSQGLAASVSYAGAARQTPRPRRADDQPHEQEREERADECQPDLPREAFLLLATVPQRYLPLPRCRSDDATKARQGTARHRRVQWTN